MIDYKNNGNLPESIALLYSDAKREYFPTEQQFLTEQEVLPRARVISKYIEKLGIKTYLFPGNDRLPELLRKNKPEMAINLVDSVKGSEFLQSTIPALLELIDIPYTGAGILGTSLVSNKFLVKKILEQNGIPVPRYQLISNPSDPLDPHLRFPLISKLNEIHGTVEISGDSVSENEEHLRKRLKYLISTYKQDVIVEEFIVGAELTTVLLEGVNKKIYSAEKIFEESGQKYFLATFDATWGRGPSYSYKKSLNNEYLKELTKNAFTVLNHADYSIFDVRIDASGRLYFIDCNANPSFGPKETDCALATILDLYGINFEEILNRLILNTMRGARDLEKIEPTPNGNHEQALN